MGNLKRMLPGRMVGVTRQVALFTNSFLFNGLIAGFEIIVCSTTMPTSQMRVKCFWTSISLSYVNRVHRECYGVYISNTVIVWLTDRLIHWLTGFLMDWLAKTSWLNQSNLLVVWLPNGTDTIQWLSSKLTELIWMTVWLSVRLNYNNLCVQTFSGMPRVSHVTAWHYRHVNSTLDGTRLPATSALLR